MRTLSSTRAPRLLAALALVLLGTSQLWAVELEAKRVRFLLVVDTDDSGGATWGLDGKNFKAVLDAGLKKQQLEGRYTVDMLTGQDVTAAHVLKHYRSMKVEPDDALVFYYSGHGAQHVSRGHFLAFTHGALFRNELLTAMRAHNPRLVVVLTDCCADYAGGMPGRPARPSTPPAGTNPPINLDGAADIPDPPLPGRKAPAGLGLLSFTGLGDVRRPPETRRPVDSGRTRNRPTESSIVFATGDGPLPLKRVLDRTDGTILRHLFYRHSGLVDINGCKKGKSSHGTIPWGGSLFTIGFMCLQHQPIAKFDTNHNGLVEWTEFFPHMQTSCDRAGQSVGVRQVPDATQLGQPVVLDE